MRSRDIIDLYEIVGRGAEVTVVDVPLASVIPILAGPKQLAQTNQVH
jgi:hypothetical protein